MDPISDMIIRIKYASMAGHDTVSMPQSGVKAAIAAKLKERGFVADVSTHGKKVEKTLELTLTRDESGAYRFKNVRRVSKPGCRAYVGVSDLRPVRGGTGMLLVSTPKGVLYGDEARKANVGGEALFEIW